MDAPPPHHAGGIGNPGAAEAVREDLIGDALSEPGRHLLRPVVYRELEGPQLLPAAVQALQAEGVPHQAHIVPGLQGDVKHIPVPLQAPPGHGQLPALLVPVLKVGDKGGGRKSPGPGRAEGQLYPGAGGYGAIGALIPAVPAVKGLGITHKERLPSAEQGVLGVHRFHRMLRAEIVVDNLAGGLGQISARGTALHHDGDDDLRVVIGGEQGEDGVGLLVRRAHLGGGSLATSHMPRFTASTLAGSRAMWFFTSGCCSYTVSE